MALSQNDIDALVASQAPFHALYESGFFARQAAGENDPRLAGFRDELYAEQFDAEYDAKCQAADSFNKEGR